MLTYDVHTLWQKKSSHNLVQFDLHISLLLNALELTVAQKCRTGEFPYFMQSFCQPTCSE